MLSVLLSVILNHINSVLCLVIVLGTRRVLLHLQEKSPFQKYVRSYPVTFNRRTEKPLKYKILPNLPEMLCPSFLTPLKNLSLTISKVLIRIQLLLLHGNLLPQTRPSSILPKAIPNNDAKAPINSLLRLRIHDLLRPYHLFPRYVLVR